jgi:transposase-like protein
VAGPSRFAYTKEFREDAVRLARSSGKSILTVSKEISTVGESLHKWILDGPDLADGFVPRRSRAATQLRGRTRSPLRARDASETRISSTL